MSGSSAVATRAASVGIDRDGARARPLLRAGPLRALLGGADREAALDDLAREPAAALVVGHREDGARVAFAQLAALDHPEHVVGQLEQADPVRDGRLRAADALRDFAEREAELVDEDGVRARLLDRGQLLARDVLDEAEQERVAVVDGAHDGRNRLAARLARGTPAALARDDLVAADAARADEERLDDALLPHRVGEARRGLRLEPAARLLRVRVDRVDGDLEQLGRSRGAADQDFEAAAETATRAADSGALDKLHRHLPVGVGSGGATVVGNRGQAVARRLGEAHRPRHGRAEDERSEMAAHFLPRPARRGACGRRPS